MEIEYKKYRWFETKSGKIVVGGKSAAQNDELLKLLKSKQKELIVMHTSTPGSPFSIILSDINKVTKSDLEESAIFTGCFSRAWRERKSSAEIHIFKLSQLSKSSSMKLGTWGIEGKPEKSQVKLELALIVQKSTLRAVPEKTAEKKNILFKVRPGKIDKTNMLPKLALELNDKFSQEEILSSLPSGGVSICKPQKS